MKKIKIFIVTYKRKEVLNELIDNIFESDFSKIENTEVNIINNHSNFDLYSKYSDKVNVIHNQTRPDWSGANLGENWNQAIINGFKSLRNPDTEILVTLQNDCVLDKNWASNLLKMHEKYNFIAGEFGDNIVSYKSDAIKKIGLWDENFSGGGHREADYYLRALCFNKEKSLINDVMHGRVWNPNNDYLKLDIPDGRNINKELKRRPDDEEHEQISIGIRGSVLNRYNVEYFYQKWKNTHYVELIKSKWIKNWPSDLIDNPPKIRNGIVFMKYPYFEKDIQDLREKGYWVPKGFGNNEWNIWESRIAASNKDTY